MKFIIPENKFMLVKVAQKVIANEVWVEQNEMKMRPIGTYLFFERKPAHYLKNLLKDELKHDGAKFAFNYEMIKCNVECEVKSLTQIEK